MAGPAGGGTVVAIHAETMGRGDDALGAKLMGSWLRTLATLDEKPDAIVFTNGGVGRWDLPGGNLDELHTSLKRLAELEVRDIYPGHMSWSEGDGKDHIQLGLMSLAMY